MNAAREEALFALALEKPADKRPAFLDAMCEGDSALRARLDVLLAAHEQPDAALATAAPNVKATIKIEFADAPDEAVGQTLGRYKLLERVGEGGCGHPSPSREETLFFAAAEIANLKLPLAHRIAARTSGRPTSKSTSLIETQTQ